MSISIASRKAKGRNFQGWIAKQISRVTGIPDGKDELIEKREMGQQGVDIKLYGIAKEKYPFSIEAKNQMTFSIPSWVKQAKENKIKGTDWQLFITKNHYDKLVIMDADTWFDFWEQYLNLLYGKDHKIAK